MSSPCPDDNLLAQLIGGQLDAARSEQVRAHLDDCPSCAALFRELASVLPAPPPDEEGREAILEKIGRYQILERLGAGTMGVVYRGWDPELEREVAIKLLREDLARWHDDAAQASARLLREARALASLTHPHVVTVYDAGTFEGRVYMVSALVRGTSARAWCVGKSWREIVWLHVQAARGLQAAHQRGIVHRDIKPENLLVDLHDQAIVADFGLATAPLDVENAKKNESLLLTTSGALVGTPAYMAPEQLDGQPATPQADQYALCVSLHEALYGFRPYTGRTLEELARQARRGELAAPRSRSVPTHLFRVLARGLSPRPADRYSDMGGLIDALERASRPRMTRALVGSGVLLFVLLGALGLATFQDAPVESRAMPAPVVSVTPSITPPALPSIAPTILDAQRWVAVSWRAAEAEARRSPITPVTATSPPQPKPRPAMAAAPAPKLPPAKTPLERLKRACLMNGSKCERDAEPCVVEARAHLREHGAPPANTQDPDDRAVIALYGTAAECAYSRDDCDEVWTFVQASGWAKNAEHDVIQMVDHYPRCPAPSRELGSYALHTAMLTRAVAKRGEPRACIAHLDRIMGLEDLWRAVREQTKEAKLLSGALNELVKCVAPRDCDRARTLWFRSYALYAGAAYVAQYRVELEQSFLNAKWCDVASD